MEYLDGSAYNTAELYMLCSNTVQVEMPMAVLGGRFLHTYVPRVPLSVHRLLIPPPKCIVAYAQDAGVMPRFVWSCACGETFPTKRGVINHQGRRARTAATPYSAIRQGSMYVMLLWQ